VQTKVQVKKVLKYEESFLHFYKDARSDDRGGLYTRGKNNTGNNLHLSRQYYRPSCRNLQPENPFCVMIAKRSKLRWTYINLQQSAVNMQLEKFAQPEKDRDFRTEKSLSLIPFITSCLPISTKKVTKVLPI
jgi:hypothetical protein